MNMSRLDVNNSPKLEYPSVPNYNLPELNYHEALGIMLWLCNQAEYHKTWPLWAVDSDIIPPLIHRQFKIYFDEQKNPVGFATWAWLSNELKHEMIAGGSLEFDDWSSGQHVMVNDFIAPWGHAKAIIKDLLVNVFPNEAPFSLGRNPDGTVRKLYRWKGKDCIEKVFSTSAAD